MSKIYRALRKAEEERRRKESPRPVTDERHADAGADAADEAAKIHTEPEPTAEHFRRIAAKLNSYYESVGPVSIVFTSAVSGEGKTTTAMNCAVSLCRDFNLSVCLVDGDLYGFRHVGSEFRRDVAPALDENALLGDLTGANWQEQDVERAIDRFARDPSHALAVGTEGRGCVEVGEARVDPRAAGQR